MALRVLKTGSIGFAHFDSKFYERSFKLKNALHFLAMISGLEDFFHGLYVKSNITIFKLKLMVLRLYLTVQKSYCYLLQQKLLFKLFF